MPIVNKRSSIVPPNARNADVASRMVQHLAPIQQQKTQASFRVQGIEAVLYNSLHQGRPCTCHRENQVVQKLSPDGKATPGTINRVLTGNTNFGISDYRSSADDPEDSEFEAFDPYPLSDGGLNTVGGALGGTANQIENVPTLGDNGQFSPDLESLMADFDLGSLGLSDVSCPICFGTGYIGGYSVFRGYRNVLIPTDFETDSVLELPSLKLSPGTHAVTLTLPMGVTSVLAFRALSGSMAVSAHIFIDNSFIADYTQTKQFFNGRPHRLRLECDTEITHFEIEALLSKDSVYFEIPKLTNTADLSLLEQQEPFQITVSPEIPDLKSLDIIAESQFGKLLIVQQANVWNTRTRQVLGWECQVRVAQPQELWNILPSGPVGYQRRTLAAKPTNSSANSGYTNPDMFEF